MIWRTLQICVCRRKRRVPGKHVHLFGKDGAILEGGKGNQRQAMGEYTTKNLPSFLETPIGVESDRELGVLNPSIFLGTQPIVGSQTGACRCAPGTEAAF